MKRAAVAPAIVLVLSSIGLGGCDRSLPGLSAAVETDERTLTASKLSISLRSNAVREVLRSAGVEVPELLVAYRRGETEVLAFPVHAGDAFVRWKSLRSAVEKSGLYPVILHDQYASFQWSMDDASETPIAEAIAAANEIDPAAWFKSHMDDIGKDDPEDVIPRDPGAVCEISQEPLILRDPLTRKPRQNLFIMLVPTTRGYEVPAILNWGDFNSCPRAEEHVAILRYWHERFGTDVVAMDGATLELLPARSPAEGEESLAVAIEQYLYCPDIVDQGVGSVDALAYSLAKGPMWFFWWD